MDQITPPFRLLPAAAATPPYAAQVVPTMMRDAEARLLFQIARDHVAPGRACIDAGAFLGGGAANIAAGLAARPDRAAFLKSVHSYDLFLNGSEFYSRFLHGTVPTGGSFFPQFLSNTREYADYINAYPGDFTTFKWIGQPIGLFFCDISKNTALDAHVWREFSPSFIPGETLFVQQDFVHIQAPFVHVALGALEDHFDFLLVEAPSLLLRLRRPIDPRVARLAIRTYSSGTAEERLAALDALAARVAPLGHAEATATLALVKAVLHCRAGDPDAAEALMRETMHAHPDLSDNYYHARLRALTAMIATARGAPPAEGAAAADGSAPPNPDALADDA